MSNIIWKSIGTAKEEGHEIGKSIWNEKVDKDTGEHYYKRMAPLKDNINVDVVVIGAGMAGILIAYMLKESGKSVIILEKDTIGGKITRNTTAKITSQHNLIYNKLLIQKGEERAREYAMSNERAIYKYKELIEKHEIHCDFEVLPSYIYTLDDEDKIRKEVEAAKKVGIHATFTKEVNIPLRAKAAIRFDEQAQFHPLKFINGISKNLYINERTIIKEIRSDGLIITDGAKIKARDVVIASHYPFINSMGYYFLKMHQERFYVGALKGWNKTGERLGGMYLDADPNGFSFRDYQEFLLLGTGNHRTGKKNPLNAYEKIERGRDVWYPEADIEYIWSNQDCITPDSIPYIGKYSTKLPNFYVATGFNKWGMTSSMVSAMVISDMICKKFNPYRKVFYPQRLLTSSSHKIAKDTSITATNFISERLKIAKDNINKIEKGEAGVVDYKGQKLGVYRDNEDNYHFVTTKCPHLGCSLAWNPNELTWDCPCHGSRFDYHGKLINNPATRNVFDTFQSKQIE